MTMTPWQRLTPFHVSGSQFEPTGISSPAGWKAWWPMEIAQLRPFFRHPNWPRQGLLKRSSSASTSDIRISQGSHGEGVWVGDAEGYLRFCNAFASRLLEVLEEYHQYW